MFWTVLTIAVAVIALPVGLISGPTLLGAKGRRSLTAAVPMMMPSTDSIERNLCNHRLRIARTKLRRDLSQKSRNRFGVAGFMIFPVRRVRLSDRMAPCDR